MDFLFEQWVDQAENKYGLNIQGVMLEMAQEFFLHGDSPKDLLDFIERSFWEADMRSARRAQAAAEKNVVTEIPF